MKPSSTLPRPSTQYIRDFRWIESHLDRLSRDYPNQWVAVHKGKVIASGDQLTAVKDAIGAILGDKEIPVYFVDDGTIILGELA